MRKISLTVIFILFLAFLVGYAAWLTHFFNSMLFGFEP